MHDFELEMIRFLHQFRTEELDCLFRYINFFDRIEFFFILIPLVWLWKGVRIAGPVIGILLLSKWVNVTLKGLFASPRPFHLDPSLAVIKVGGFGFPSGAAQTVILLSGILILQWSNPWKWPIALFYAALISFSRIYLGVHFPTDILGGWIVGLGLLALYTYGIKTPIRKFT